MSKFVGSMKYGCLVNVENIKKVLKCEDTDEVYLKIYYNNGDYDFFHNDRKEIELILEQLNQLVIDVADL